MPQWSMVTSAKSSMCEQKEYIIQIYIDNNMFNRHQNNYHDCHCAKNVSAGPSVMQHRLIIIVYYIIIILIVSYTRRWHTHNYQTIQCQIIDVPGGVTSQPQKPMSGPRNVWRTWRHLYNQWWWCNTNTQVFVHTHTSLFFTHYLSNLSKVENVCCMTLPSNIWLLDSSTYTNSGPNSYVIAGVEFNNTSLLTSFAKSDFRIIT